MLRCEIRETKLKYLDLRKSLTSLGKELRIDGLECLLIHHSTWTLLLKRGRKYVGVFSFKSFLHQKSGTVRSRQTDRQTDVRSWSLCRGTEAPSWWTWSEPAAGPALQAGAVPWRAPGRCHCCLFEGWIDRQEAGEQKRREKTGRIWQTLSVWMQVNTQGGVGRMCNREGGSRGQEIEQKKYIKEGGKSNREALSLWWRVHQLLIAFLKFNLVHIVISHTIRESTGKLGKIFTKREGRSIKLHCFYTYHLLNRKVWRRRKGGVKGVNGEQWERQTVGRREKKKNKSNHVRYMEPL